MEEEMLPVSAETCTVNGSSHRATTAAWQGLDLKRAEIREQSTMMVWVLGAAAAPEDHHLRTPWIHPEDLAAGATPEDWCFYRVRPKMTAGRKWKSRRVESVNFERRGEDWALRVTYASPLPSHQETR